MDDQQRTALRAAVLIHQQRTTCLAPGDAIYLPQHSWQNIGRLRRQIERAAGRGWLRAAQTLARDLVDSLRYLTRELENAARAIETHLRPVNLSTPAEIFRDLLAIRQEFDEVTIDLATHEICVTTEPIVLEDIGLGAFQIRLDWQRLGGPRHPYRVVALDPHPAARNDEVTHPHVQGEQLCEGEGRSAIAAALAECRLLDFFLLVSQVLRTYGRGNAYVELTAEYPAMTVVRAWTRTNGMSATIATARCATPAWALASIASSPSARPACTNARLVAGTTADRACAPARSAASNSARTAGRATCAARVTTNRTKRNQTMIPKKINGSPNRSSQTVEHEAALRLDAPRAKPPILRFSPTAWAKLLYLRDVGDSEVGGFGISAADDLLYIQDVELVSQECDLASVAFDDQGVADFFDRQIDAGRKMCQVGRVWVHTLPGNCAAPSSKDEETFARAFGRTDWSVMFILARHGQTSARLEFHVGPGGSLLLPVEVDYHRPFPGSDEATWREQ